MTPTVISTAQVESEDDMLPPGMMAHFGGTTAPAGWLKCDGTDYLSADYPALSAYLAGAWNTFRGQASPGAGRFRVPKANGLALIAVGGADSIGVNTSERSLADLLGEEAHILVTGELASHNHPSNAAAEFLLSGPGTTVSGANGADWSVQVGDDASAATGLSGSGLAHNNMQPSVAGLLCIKT